MIINNGDDYILKLKLKDERGNDINPKEKASFYVRVFTINKNKYIEFTQEDIIGCDYDCFRIFVDSTKLASLESGVISYIYGWGVSNNLRQRCCFRRVSAGAR